MIFEKYIPGQPKTEAYFAFCDMMKDFDLGVSYADMMRVRITGALAEECHDVYYIAHEDGKGIGRHWNGWGKHPNAIGNWGGFFVNEAYRGKGVGGNLLRLWWEDFQASEDRPLCFCCTAGSKDLTQLYNRFGFVPAIEGTDRGPLYMPVGDSPATFREFYNVYYKPTDHIIRKSATVEYRHEIDCLLRFALKDQGIPFGIDDVSSMEAALLYWPERAGILFSDDGRTVGWTFDQKMQVYPRYSSLAAEQFPDFEQIL